MNNKDEPTSAAPRISCRPTLPVFIALSGERGSIAGTMISANTRKRSQAISIEGSIADRYFAVTSETPRNTVDDRISAMPLNGRSARAGARRAADFLSDNCREALSSLATASAADLKSPECAGLTRIGDFKSPCGPRIKGLLAPMTFRSSRKGACPRSVANFGKWAPGEAGESRQISGEKFRICVARENDNWPESTTPDSGMPICATRAALKLFVKEVCMPPSYLRNI